MIAPVLPYGMTGSMEAYPGAFQITEAAYRPFVKQILEGLAIDGAGHFRRGGLHHR